MEKKTTTPPGICLLLKDIDRYVFVAPNVLEDFTAKLKNNNLEFEEDKDAEKKVFVFDQIHKGIRFYLSANYENVLKVQAA